MNNPALQPGTVLEETYRVERKLGEGGFGDIYLATHIEWNQRVALKVLRPDENNTLPDLVERFRREVALARRLEHPNIVRMYELGRLDDGTLYMTMEYVKGQELEQILLREGRLSFDRTVHIVVQILSALEEAHNKGIVHRDLKPANIMLTQTDGRPDIVKLLDFGIAKAFDGTYTDLTAQNLQRSVGFGTPQYMAPEQIMGQNIGPHTDLYALGLIFIELVTGSAPMLAEHPTDIIRKQLREEVPIPVWLDHSVAGPILYRLLQKDHRTRYQSAMEVFREIDHRILKADNLQLEGYTPPEPKTTVSNVVGHGDESSDTIVTNDLDTMLVEAPTSAAAATAATAAPTSMVEAPPGYDPNPTLLSHPPPSSRANDVLGMSLPVFILIVFIMLTVILLMILMVLV